MKDWDYLSAKRRADLRFEACVRTHILLPGGCACSCGWVEVIETSFECLSRWREHVDTSCIVAQVRANTRRE